MEYSCRYPCLKLFSTLSLVLSLLDANTTPPPPMTKPSGQNPPIQKPLTTPPPPAKHPPANPPPPPPPKPTEQTPWEKYFQAKPLRTKPPGQNYQYI